MGFDIVNKRTISSAWTEEREELPPLSTLRPLSDADRDMFLAVLDRPPNSPTESHKKAMAATRS
jgi:uncharacterized protein (DUF1778 family)